MWPPSITSRHQSSTNLRFAFSLSFIAGLVCGLVGGLIDAANAAVETARTQSSVARTRFEAMVVTKSPRSWSTFLFLRTRRRLSRKTERALVPAQDTTANAPIAVLCSRHRELRGGLHVTTRKDDRSDGVSRRAFLAGASAAGVALAGGDAVDAQTAAEPAAGAAPPSGAQLAREHGGIEYTEQEHDRYFVDDPGSDLMVDLLKSLDIDYVTMNAGSSFRGLHESILNHGGNKKPEIITCVHEEQSVAMAHGYAKVAGKPIVVACHGTVGIQHAAMAVYNAWVDRVPMVIVAGNYIDGDERRTIEWIHAAQDCIQPIRD